MFGITDNAQYDLKCVVESIKLENPQITKGLCVSSLFATQQFLLACSPFEIFGQIERLIECLLRSVEQQFFKS